MCSFELWIEPVISPHPTLGSTPRRFIHVYPLQSDHMMPWKKVIRKSREFGGKVRREPQLHWRLCDNEGICAWWYMCIACLIDVLSRIRKSTAVWIWFSLGWRHCRRCINASPAMNLSRLSLIDEGTCSRSKLSKPDWWGQTSQIQTSLLARCSFGNSYSDYRWSSWLTWYYWIQWRWIHHPELFLGATELWFLWQWWTMKEL